MPITSQKNNYFNKLLKLKLNKSKGVTMMIEGKQVPLSSWQPRGEQIWKEQRTEGWHIYEKYSKQYEENENVRGYRIMVHRDGEYYSPFIKIGLLEERTQKVGDINYNSGNGLYFFTDREVAENYLASLIVKTRELMLRNHDYSPTGEIVMHAVEGVAAGKGLYGDEGERMKEMYIYKKPLISVTYKEIAQL